MSDTPFRIYFQDSGKPALVVAIDHDDVVPAIKTREPYSSIARIFEAASMKTGDLRAEIVRTGELCQTTGEPVDDVSPFWNNCFFTGADARAAYAFARMRNPSRIVEIGSGNSTKFFRKAIREGSLRTVLTSIDPQPRAEIGRVADEIIAQGLTKVPLETFRSLSAGDILFLDGSHLCFHGSDVPHFFLRVLPEVAPGVLVHIHDIYLPEEYPEHFDQRYYSEQYVLGAFLLHNPDWLATLPIHYLYGKGLFPADGCAFWMEKTGQPG